MSLLASPLGMETDLCVSPSPGGIFRVGPRRLAALVAQNWWERDRAPRLRGHLGSCHACAFYQAVILMSGSALGVRSKCQDFYSRP